MDTAARTLQFPHRGKKNQILFYSLLIKIVWQTHMKQIPCDVNGGTDWAYYLNQEIQKIGSTLAVVKMKGIGMKSL